MRWNNFDNGEKIRVVWRFLIFPKTLFYKSGNYRRETRWFEWAKIEQYLIIDSLYPVNRRWKDEYWGD